MSIVIDPIPKAISMMENSVLMHNKLYRDMISKHGKMQFLSNKMHRNWEFDVFVD